MKIGILQNESEDSVKKWIIACKKKHIDYEVIPLFSNDWLERVVKSKCDIYLQRPSGTLLHYKNAYDERGYIISEVLKYRLFPKFNETIIYENKKMLSYFLQAKKIPHPRTDVFYDKKEARSFVETNSYPIVSKTSIGASGSGVKIIKNEKEAKKYINQAFSRQGIKRRFGPNRVTGNPHKWLTKALKSPRYFINKTKSYLTEYSHGECDYVIFQEFIPHDYEWRVVKIGKSYFAHKKVKFGDKASGSKEINYVNPPLSILDFVKEICDENKFEMMAVDIFEDISRGYLVNELQTLFGHVQDYIMIVDGKIGRYIYDNGWVFEEGDFNANESYDLRLEHAIDLLKDERR